MLSKTVRVIAIERGRRRDELSTEDRSDRNAAAFFVSNIRLELLTLIVIENAGCKLGRERSADCSSSMMSFCVKTNFPTTRVQVL
jgi:hypothetical protein